MSEAPENRRGAIGLTGLVTAPMAIAARLSAPLVDAGVRAAAAARLPERVVDALVESGAADRVIARAFDNGLMDRVTDELLASEELRRIVAQIARSDEVLAALRSQSVGLVDEVAGEVRGRTDSVDDALERVVRRLLRRSARTAPATVVTEAPPARPQP